MEAAREGGREGGRGEGRDLGWYKGKGRRCVGTLP